MDMVSVQSSQISQIGHEGDVLRVLFNRGDLYEFDGVSPSEFEALRGAQSIGKHFNATIKGRKTMKRLSADGQWSSPAPAEIKAEAKAVEPAQIETTKREGLDLVARAKGIVVNSVATDREAKEMLLVVRAQSKQVDATFDPDIARWHAGHKAALAMKAEFKTPLNVADAYLLGQINDYALAEKRRVDAEQRRLAAEAAEKAAREAKEEAERLALEDAIALEEQGDMVAAEAVLANPVPVVPRYVAPAPVAREVAQVKGVSQAQIVLQIRITDPSKVPDEYKVIDEAMILGVVRRTQGKIRIPGVEVYEGASTAVRTGRR
jgi:hypothetical protein